MFPYLDMLQVCVCGVLSIGNYIYNIHISIYIYVFFSYERLKIMDGLLIYV